MDTKVLRDSVTSANNIAMNTTSEENDIEGSQQKSKLRSGLITTSLYVNNTSTGLHLLKDSIVWDSSATCYICNNLDYAITLLQPLSKETYISTTLGNELVIRTANIAIQCIWVASFIKWIMYFKLSNPPLNSTRSK